MQKITDLKKIDTKINFEDDKDKTKKFLLFFQEDGEFKYLERIRTMGESITIDLDDIALYDDSNLLQRILANAQSYLKLFSTAIDEIIYNEGECENMDVFFYHRVSKFKERYPDKKITDVFPSFLLRNYTVFFTPPSALCEPRAIRTVRAENIGSFMSVRGIVTKVSVVKPSARVATYICESCGTETYQQVAGDAFDLLEECGSEKCRIRNVRGTLTLLSRGSRFLKFQAVQLQELTSDVPQGSIPRTLSVECYATNTDMMRPGEFVSLSGIFLPRPYYGIKKLKAGLLNDTYFYMCSRNKSNTLNISNINDIKTLDINNDINNEIIIEKMIESFAPEIFGMKDVKKILLLMLVGSPVLKKADGMRVRGDINVLLMGDPGIAKSQLLKTAVRLAERGVYTTGRGSSGVGLTASVNKDPVTREVVLEGGALVLSDGGICCIDELDKMNESDRIGIHEVMEQQTVSISKAGINTTLNARCSILAAANPVKGRYDAGRSLEQNVGLPASLLSRFDVLCILRDDANEDYDIAMAEHITGMHVSDRNGDINENDINNGINENSINDNIDSNNNGTYSYEELREHLRRAKAIDPVLSPEVRSILVDAYLNLRKEGATPRGLLAMIRLSMAHARLRLSTKVDRADAEEAINLVELMKVPKNTKKSVENAKHAIYNYIVGLAEESNGNRVVKMERIWESCPYERSAVEDVIFEFGASGVWLRNNEELMLFD
ncbi:DNA replication licensing factor MCM7 [Enteropsectra breve]|nr:DNA replication licensing factor MCM7 [Enteropsectra breve]